MYWKVNSNVDKIGLSSYQIVLNEGSTDILFNYGADYGAGSGGVKKTMVGIENSDGSIGLRYPGFDKPGQYKRRTVRFYLGSAPSPVYDNDGDGYNSDVDCNDNNPAIHPDAQEICGDGIDNNCNGMGDEICGGSPDDKDGDGYNSDVDCNDNNPAIHPDAGEICGDAIDNNCNGMGDEICTGVADKDKDGYTSDVDCNDSNPTIHPEATEICGDGIDNNCNGDVDEECSSEDPGNGEDPNGVDPVDFVYLYLTSKDIDGPAYEWETFTENAQRMSIRADSGLQSAIPANGFFYKPEVDSNPPFEFYGEKYNRVYIAGNGYLAFNAQDTHYTNFAYNGQEFPAVDEANNLIAPLWLGGQSAADASTLINVIYETLGNEPQRRFVMQFNRQGADDQEIAYQVVFFEDENTIKFNYKSIGSLEGAFFVAGIEDSDGSGLRYAGLEKPAEVSEQSVLFYRGAEGSNPGNEGPATIYMPLVMTGTWQTSVVLLNAGATKTTGTLYGHDATGEVIFSSSDNLEMEPRAQVEGLLGDFFGSADLTKLAYLSFVSAADSVVGSVHLKVKDQGMTGAYPARSSVVASKTLFLPSVIVGAEGWGNIVSLINTGAEQNKITVEFDNGAKKHISLSPGQQFYFYPVADMEVLSAQGKLTSLRDTTPLPTSAVVRGGEGLVGAALYYHGEKLSAVALDNRVATEIIYPYLLDGSGWWGGLAFYNPQVEATNTTLTGFLGDGKIVKLELPRLSLGKQQSRSIASHDILADGVGWLRVKADAPIAGLEFFGTTDYRQLASVSTGGLQGKTGLFSHLRSGEEGGWSGLLLNNPNPNKNPVILSAYDVNGKALAVVSKDILANEQLLVEVKALFKGFDIKAAVSIGFTAESDVVGVIFNGRYYDDDGYLMEELEALPPLSVPPAVGLD